MASSEGLSRARRVACGFLGAEHWGSWTPGRSASAGRTAPCGPPGSPRSGVERDGAGAHGVHDECTSASDPSHHIASLPAQAPMPGTAATKLHPNPRGGPWPAGHRQDPDPLALTCRAPYLPPPQHTSSAASSRAARPGRTRRCRRRSWSPCCPRLEPTRPTSRGRRSTCGCSSSSSR